MRRPLLRLWLGGSTFSAVLALGCSHGELVRSDPAPGAAVVAAPKRQIEDENEEEYEDEPAGLPGGTVPATFRQVAAPAAPTGLGPRLAPSPEPPPTVLQADRPIGKAPAPLRLVRLASPVLPLAPVPSSPEQLAVLERPRSAITQTPAHRPPPKAIFAHAADYRWLVGQLRLLPDQETWSVRYAPADENDRHGGALTLVSPGPMHGFHSGQFVRVEGELVDPAPHEIEPGYRVHAIQVLDQR